MRKWIGRRGSERRGRGREREGGGKGDGRRKGVVKYRRTDRQINSEVASDSFQGVVTMLPSPPH